MRILVVEDHADTLRAMSRLLEMSGHCVRTATCVAEALHAATQEAFDLIISDLGLPDGSGHDVMRELAGRSGVRGICLSGYDGQDDLNAARAAGFQDHLTKPIDFQKLQAAIERISAR